MRKMNIIAASCNLLEAKGIFDSFEIPLGIHEGTLLGIVRDGTFIAWDYDIDCWLSGDTPQSTVIKIKDELIKEGFELKETFYSSREEIIAWSHRKRELTIGFNILRLSLDGECFCDLTEFFGKQRPTFTLVPHKFYTPPAEIQFLGQKFLIPNPPEEYLMTRYGPTWQKPLEGRDRLNDQIWKKDCTLTSVYPEEYEMSPWGNVTKRKEKKWFTPGTMQ